MDSVIRDLAYGARQLVRSKGTTFAAVVCIALGVGANTTIFSLVDSLLLRPIPGIESSDRLVEVGRRHRGGAGLDSLTWTDYRGLRERSRVLEELAAWTFSPVAVSDGPDPEVVLGLTVTPSYFEVLGLEPEMGRFFTEEEAPGPGARALVVLSHGYWRRRFGGDPSVVGRVIRINGHPATVVGVGPEGFRGHLGAVAADLWVPLGLQAPGLPSREMLEGRRNHFLLAIGRLRPGVPVDLADESVARTYSDLTEDDPRLQEQTAGLAEMGTLPAFLRGPVSLFLAVLMSIVTLVLLIACVNVAGILTARTTARSRELAIRRALGAGRARIARQVLTETLLLFGLGGGAGLLIALWGTRLLGSFRPPLPPPFDLRFDLAIDLRVLAFTLVATFATALVFGLGPALRASRQDPLVPLKNETPASSSRRSRARAFLVSAQVAMTLILLVASGLFLRSLSDARRIDPGFEAEGVMITRFDLKLHGYTEETGREFVRRLLERMEARPEVDSAAVARLLPLGLPSSVSWGGVNVEGVEPPPRQQSWGADLNAVSPGYFETLGIELIAGRGFTESDDGSTRKVAVINESMARRFWPHGDPVGKRFFMGPMSEDDAYEIVGVAADAKYSTFCEETPLFTYLPMQQAYHAEMALQVRGRGGRNVAAATIRETIRQLDPAIPVNEVIPLEDYVAVGLLPQRLAGAVSGLAGLVGLLLAAVGVFGTTAHAATRRRREMGIRRALGASDRDVLTLMVRQGMAAPAVGLVVGTALAAALTRFLSSFLFGIGALDLATFAAAVLVLASVAVAANLVPARRAATTDPMESLRVE